MMTDLNLQGRRALSLTAQFKRWWMAHSPQRRKSLMTRGGLACASFSAVLIGMPVLANLNAERQGAQQFRELNVRLAAAPDAGSALRAHSEASSLLRHDWLRSVEYSLERDPGSALSRYAALERDRAALHGLGTLDFTIISNAEDLLAQSRCLAEAVYYEARSEKASGQIAVAEVIMNRVKDHRYPNTICGVVYQGATRTTGCQFTFTCDGAMSKAPRGPQWRMAKTIASHVLLGLNETKTNGATHYHATYVDPIWNSGLVKTAQIDTHIFYRFPRGGEWAAASASQSRRLEQARSGLDAILPALSGPDAKPKVIRAAAPAFDLQPITAGEAMVEPDADDLNGAQLNALAAAAPGSDAQTDLAERADLSLEARISPVSVDAGFQRRIVRRVVDGEIVEEDGKPVRLASTAS